MKDGCFVSVETAIATCVEKALVANLHFGQIRRLVRQVATDYCNYSIWSGDLVERGNCRWFEVCICTRGLVPITIIQIEVPDGYNRQVNEW